MNCGLPGTVGSGILKIPLTLPVGPVTNLSLSSSPGNNLIDVPLDGVIVLVPLNSWTVKVEGVLLSVGTSAWVGGFVVVNNAFAGFVKFWKSSTVEFVALVITVESFSSKNTISYNLFVAVVPPEVPFVKVNLKNCSPSLLGALSEVNVIL